MVLPTIPMSHSKKRADTISLSQFGPQVQTAGYFEFLRATEFHYQLKLHHFLLVERGQVEAVTSEGPVCANAHDLLCLRPAAAMSYKVVNGTTFYQATVQFSPAPRNLLTPELPEVGPLPIHTPTGDAFREFCKLFEMICIELPQIGSRHHFRVQGAVYRILALLASAVEQSAEPPAPLDAWEHAYLRCASNEAGEISANDLASDLGVSKGHFFRVFKQRFGTNPGMCRMHARLGEAVRRLRETDETVKSIGYRLGFDGAKGLSRAMKKHLNLTASQFRHEPGDGSTNVTTPPPGGLFPSNQHLLPPGDHVDLLMARYNVSRREL